MYISIVCFVCIFLLFTFVVNKRYILH